MHTREKLIDFLLILKAIRQHSQKYWPKIPHSTFLLLDTLHTALLQKYFEACMHSP